MRSFPLQERVGREEERKSIVSLSMTITADGNRKIGGGGNSHMEQTGMLVEILNLTPKGDHLGVAQAFCDP